jgi:HAD superfamily hydrolase (TIGR01450 family)
VTGTSASAPSVTASTATRRFAAYVFDLDGTIYVDDELTAGAAEALDWVRATGARVAFLTNNPLHRGATYVDKLRGLGIRCATDEVLTSLDALTGYLHGAPPDGPILLIAEALVGDVLTEAGFQLTQEPESAAMVVVSWDRGFDYARLLAAFRAVRNGARIVATNPDPFCPTADGGLPDCAAMLAALEACTGVRAEAVVGKPSRHMAATILRHIGVPASETLMVGDRLLTDVGLARTAGMVSGLVLSGATTAADALAAPVPPDLVLGRLTDLIPADDPLAPVLLEAHS